MRRTQAFSVLVMAPLLAFMAGCCPGAKRESCPRPGARAVIPPPQPQPPARARVEARERPAWPFSCEEGISLIRRQMAAHVHLSELLGWYTRTRGEKSMHKALFVGREQIFSRRTLAFLKDCMARIQDPVEKRATGYLRNHVATAYIQRKTASLSDDIAAAEIGATARLAWRKDPVPYRELPVILSREAKRKRRDAIMAAMAQVRRSVLNPLLMKKLVRTHELAQWMGFDSYVQLASEVRQADIARLIRLGDRFVKDSEPMYSRIMKQVARETVGVPFDKFQRADHARAFRAPRVERHMPRELMIPAFRHFLGGIGLDMRTAAKTAIVVDDAMRPRKNPRAACFPLEVPGDIRISVKPSGGLSSWATFFHEGGHALHFARTTTRRFAFQQLGSYSLTEAFAELFARVWEEPAWLERYGAFVGEVNRGKHRALLGGKRIRRVPRLSKKLMGYLMRNRLAYNLYLSRRYGWAKLIYEAALHGGAEDLWKGVYTGATSDRKALYKDLFSRAYGYPVDEHEAEHYLADVDPFFYAADYTRAFMLADLLHEHLREKFGARWFTNPKVGAYLKTLWADGNRYTANEIARKIGKPLDYRATLARLDRLYRESERLSGRKASRNPPRRSQPGCRPTPRQPGKCKVEY